MRLVVITPPAWLPHEPRLASRILDNYPVTLHLRKPDQGTQAIADYLDQIPEALHPRIMVHGHAALLARFNLKGVHFAERARTGRFATIRRLRRQRPDARISSAFHRIADIPDDDGMFDYIFLSPVFDSISKAGYRAAFDLGALKGFLSRSTHCVVALGGIDEQRLAVAAGLGFKGAAVLGAVWQAADPLEAVGRLASICRDIRTGGKPRPVHGDGHMRTGLA